MATKTAPPEKIIHEGREWESLTPLGKGYTRLILQACDKKQPFQIFVDPKDLEKQPKKKPGEPYTLTYRGKVEQVGGYPLCLQKKAELIAAGTHKEIYFDKIA